LLELKVCLLYNPLFSIATRVHPSLSSQAANANKSSVIAANMQICFSSSMITSHHRLGTGI